MQNLDARRMARALFTCLAVAALLAPAPAAAERQRSSSPVWFYVAPDGADAGNDCRARERPCTLQGAQSVAKGQWDFAGAGCFVSMAPGVYRGDAATVLIAGQYVGAHLCHFFGYVDDSSEVHCIDRTAVVLEPVGRPAWDVQDGAMVSVHCVTIRGGTGFFGRQHVVVDLADINCEGVSVCIALVYYAVANVARDLWISGTVNTLAGVTHHASLLFTYRSRLVVKEPVTLSHLFTSGALSIIELMRPHGDVPGFAVDNPEPISGARCYAQHGGGIIRGNIPLPCDIDTSRGGWTD